MLNGSVEGGHGTDFNRSFWQWELPKKFLATASGVCLSSSSGGAPFAPLVMPVRSSSPVPVVVRCPSCASAVCPSPYRYPRGACSRAVPVVVPSTRRAQPGRRAVACRRAGGGRRTGLGYAGPGSCALVAVSLGRRLVLCLRRLFALLAPSLGPVLFLALPQRPGQLLRVLPAPWLRPGRRSPMPRVTTIPKTATTVTIQDPAHDTFSSQSSRTVEG